MVPTIVYRCPGKCQRAGGTFDWMPASTEAALEALLADGYSLTLEEAVARVSPKPAKVPTRKELEVEAAKLGVKDPARISSGKLTQLIAESGE